MIPEVKSEMPQAVLADVVEFVVDDRGLSDLEIRKKNACGGNCNKCSAPPCKSTCKTCKRG